MTRFAALALPLLLAVTAGAQSAPELDGPYPAGFRTLSVPGISGGNASVALRVHYPARQAGTNAPLDLAAAPCPLLVFGHGFSLQVSIYDSLLRHLATHGWIAVGVATEEALLTGNLPRYVADMQAAVLGLRALGADPVSPLAGGVAPNARAAAMGHSFGGAAALVAASGRSDLFEAVVPLAATLTSPQGVDIQAATAALAVPSLHVGASQDTIVPPNANLDPLYALAPAPKRLIELRGGTHSYFHEAWAIDRLLEPPGSISVAEQQRLQRRYGHAFLEVVQRGDLRYLDFLLGPTALADGGLSRQSSSWSLSQLFASGSGAIGTTLQLHPLGASGESALLFVAAFEASIPTPFGTLQVDPLSTVTLGPVAIAESSYGTLPIAIPNEPFFQGLVLPTQALRALTGGGLELSNLWRVRIL
jgi:pimeloyl-ACP methyl ester carboxylesterase